MREIFSRIKKSDWQIIGLYYAFVYPFVYVTNSLVGRHEMWSWEGARWLLIYLMDYTLDVFILILVVFWIFHDYFQQRRYSFAFGLIVFVLAMQVFVQPILFPMMYEPISMDKLIVRFFTGLETNFANIVGLCLLLIGKQYYESKNQVMQLQKEKKASELQLLRAQVDPHFLFNNLNILDILINIDPKKASLYTKRLSSLYRYMIRHKDQDVVSLAEEWAFSEDYIFLLQQRFDALFIFENRLKQEDLNSYFIPPASMQTLLENIVKHNFALPESPIYTTIYLENHFLCVKNDRRLKNKVKDSTGMGLTNLMRRVKLLTEQKVVVETTEVSFLVKIPLVRLV
ncbi:MAG: sensor histidine kinase [Saprospiraceae bacterium]